jgi:uncharacterized membrane protein
MIKNPNRIVIGLLALLGAIGSIQTIVHYVQLYINGETGDLSTLIFSLTIMIAALIAIVLYLSIKSMTLYSAYCNSPHEIKELNKKVERYKGAIKEERNTQAVIAETFHNVSHEYRDQIRDIHMALMQQDKTQQQDIKASFRTFLIYMVENIKESFDVLTKTNCSACIKIMDEKYFVNTLVRDSVSFRKRKEATKRLVRGYSYTNNTAFLTIMTTHKSYFMNNNLKALRGAGNYINTNDTWQDHYNACIVVPIRITPKGEKGIEQSKFLGFLCVDNSQGNFDNKTCLDLLASYADHCYNLFNLYNRYQAL